MAETNGSFVLNSENSTAMAAGNTTDYPLDQTSSGEPLHEDTVSVVLIPLVIIGLLIAVAAIIFIVIRRRTNKQASRRQFAPVYYSVEHEESGNEWESQLMDEELARHANIVKPNRGNQARLQFERGGTK